MSAEESQRLAGISDRSYFGRRVGCNVGSGTDDEVAIRSGTSRMGDGKRRSRRGRGAVEARGIENDLRGGRHRRQTQRHQGERAQSGDTPHSQSLLHPVGRYASCHRQVTTGSGLHSGEFHALLGTIHCGFLCNDSCHDSPHNLSGAHWKIRLQARIPLCYELIQNFIFGDQAVGAELRSLVHQHNISAAQLLRLYRRDLKDPAVRNCRQHAEALRLKAHILARLQQLVSQRPKCRRIQPRSPHKKLSARDYIFNQAQPYGYHQIGSPADPPQRR